MISTPHRQTAVALINEAITSGARRTKACAALEISDRTLRRWTKDGQIHADQRPLVPRPERANKLSTAERMAVLDLCNSTEFASLSPSQIVPKLADQGRNLASESSFYRILRADGLQHPRAISRRQHDPGPPDQLARRVAVRDQGLKFSTVGGAKLKRQMSERLMRRV